MFNADGLADDGKEPVVNNRVDGVSWTPEAEVRLHSGRMWVHVVSAEMYNNKKREETEQAGTWLYWWLKP